ncbi:helix-turn-helix domain-containing protein [Reyranella sp. CPCC 100927]|uniref:helix-turn-helix domain-containing protein n=1 Tax=Reyranella sp. CPCC 100927 TaxID=2599616 RepID=UPI0011B63646|nr:cupin domain-containing protein [Reyranella sp. CPCC 100927]TWT03195.1 cupin domain-containing protein [Reyranella sp. CPCC 100927]
MPVRALRNAKEWSVNAAGENAPDPEEAIGGQIRELRKLKRLTLNEVASRAGISVSYLSQIERNRSRLPIGVLKRLSDVFGVHMNWFFQANATSTPEERDIIVRKGNRRQLTFTGLGIVEELLSPNLSGPLELLLSTIAPGADSGDYSHDGAEAGIVISGTLDLVVGGRSFRLEEGDSFAFDSTSVHRCSNPGELATKVVWVITPPHY